MSHKEVDCPKCKVKKLVLSAKKFASRQELNGDALDGHLVLGGKVENHVMIGACSCGFVCTLLERNMIYIISTDH